LSFGTLKLREQKHNLRSFPNPAGKRFQPAEIEEQELLGKVKYS